MEKRIRPPGYWKKYYQEHREKRLLDMKKYAEKRGYKSFAKSVSKYRKSEKGRKINALIQRRYNSKNPLRVRAWRIAGRKISLQPCEICGKEPAHRHHPDVTQPLCVVFLCPFHHKQADKRI